MSKVNFSFTLDEEEIMNRGLGYILGDLKMAPAGKLGFKVGYSDVATGFGETRNRVGEGR